MMIDKLIRIALAVASIGALAACASSSDDVDAASSAQVEFRVAEASRASLTTNTTITNAPFAVYGDMISSTAAAGASPIVVFNNTKVTYTDPNWTYEDTQYWFPGFTYSFVAHHPAEPNADIFSNLDYENNSLSFTYNYPADYKKAVDLLTATYRRRVPDYTKPDAGPFDNKVPFTFSHLLARLNFTAKADPQSPDPITITRFAVVNVSNSATYKITPNGTTDWTTDSNEEWSAYSEANATLFEKDGLTVTIQPGDSYTFFPPETDPLLIIPQSVARDLQVEITYQVGSSARQLATAKLHNTTVTAHLGVWKSGQAYSYNFTLGADDLILFSVPSVDNWRDEEGGNYVITD